MRKSLLIALLLPVLVLPFAACGKQEPVTTPVACLEGEQSWLDALKTIDASGLGPVEEQVLLGGETPISDCLPADQPAGQQQTVGQTAVEIATYLGHAARTNGNLNVDGEWGSFAAPAREAGYLVGALERGAEGSQGIHATLIERVRTAATNGLERMSSNEKDAYEFGYEAGLESG